MEQEIRRDSMKVIKKFDAYSSSVELVEIEGKEYILKTVDPEEAWNEKRFLQTMRDNNLPTLEVFSNPTLASNQLLLEYIPGSKNIEWQKPEQMEKWGQAVRRMHDVHFDSSFRISAENQEEVLDWNSHLRKALDEAVDSRLGGKTEMSDLVLEKVREFVLSRLGSSHEHFSLVHGDLHDGNTLVRNDEVILYDKSSEIFAGDPLYDLTIIMTHFPNGTYVKTDKESNKNDTALLEAFIKGYGEDFVHSKKETLDLYMVIRALDRYPNPFEVFNKEIIENIINKQ